MATDKKTPKNGTFKKGNPGGPGRPPGTPNKLNKTVKEMVLQALNNAGGEAYLQEQAKLNPTAFMTLLGKLIPAEIQADIDIERTTEQGVILIPQKFETMEEWMAFAKRHTAQTEALPEGGIIDEH